MDLPDERLLKSYMYSTLSASSNAEFPTISDSETHRQYRHAMHQVSVPHEFALRSTASHLAEAEAVPRIDLGAQQAIWPQGWYQAERHIASSTLRGETGLGLGSLS